MLKKICVALACVIVCGGMAVATTQAKMIQIKPNAYIVNSPAGQTLDVWLEVFSDSQTHPPSYVTSIVATDPNGMNAPAVNPVKAWDPYHKGFLLSFPASTWGGTIPSGAYKITVKDSGGITMVMTDSIVGTPPLPMAMITIPTPGATVTTQNLTVTWNTVSGAKIYRLILYDITSGTPIYSNAEGYRFETNLTSAAIPKGILKPNRQYRIQIDARSDNFDYDKRSRSDWLEFSTGNW